MLGHATEPQGPETTGLLRAESAGAILESKGTEIWSIEPDATVYDAIWLMDQKRSGALVVLSGGKLAGIISERDYARKVILRGRSSKEITVREIMTSEVITVSPDESVETCLRVMTNRRIRHLPVVENGALKGLLSIGDLVRSVISAQADALKHLNHYIGSSYPA